MSFQEDEKKGMQEESLKKRALKSRMQRKRELRAKLILLNSGLALVVIMAVLVGKLISLNKAGNDILAVNDSSDTKISEAEKDSGSKKETEKKPETSAKPVEPEVTGSDRWIRRDLDPDKPMVALTFDDGPYTPVTKRILATLKKYDAKATFFLVANRIPKYPDVVKQAYEQGCQIASHTYEHKFLTTLKKDQITWQIEKADQAIEKVIGCKTTALRPPGGFVNAKVKKHVDVPMICWNVDSEDWKYRNSRKILKSCRNIKDGDIILMHDLYPTTAKAVAQLVPRLQKKGYQLVTVDELLHYKGLDAKGGKVYYSGQ